MKLALSYVNESSLYYSKSDNCRLKFFNSESSGEELRFLSLDFFWMTFCFDLFWDRHEFILPMKC